jgi:hypothetical protein
MKKLLLASAIALTMAAPASASDTKAGQQQVPPGDTSALSLDLAGGASVAQLNDAVREDQAVTIVLSPNSAAITYWVGESDGWHVVTTVDTVIGKNGNDEKHSVVRFSSVLLPGQSQLISVPSAMGEQQQALRIRRLGDRIEVARVSSSA